MLSGDELFSDEITSGLGKPPARIGQVTTFPQMDNYSTSTGHRIVHGHVKATGAKAWDLHLDPKPGANAGVLVVQFPDDSAAINVFIEKYGLTFPEPSYRCDVKFTVVWRKVRYGNRPGTTNVVQTIELLPEDTVTDQVADKTTLKTEFPRDDDNQPADHWIDDKTTRGAFWALITPWIKWAGWDGKPEDFVHDKIGKLHDWTSGQQAAVERLAKEAILIRWNGTGRELGKGDFQAAVGYATLIAAWQSGLTDNEIRNLIDAHLAQPAPQTNAPEAPPANATDAGAIPLPETVSRASNTPSNPVNVASMPVSAAPEIETKPSSIIPYQPKAVAHTLNVDWKITPLEMAQFAVQSKLYAGIDNPAKAMVVMMRGLELGVSPLTALEQVNIIQGKTVVSSALFLALIERSGQLENMVIDDSRPDACTVTLTRRGRSPISATFTMDDAAKMGLANKDNWRKMPKTMLYHRALGVAGRRAFSDVLLFGGGIYMPEELAPDTVVDENGDVIAA